MSERRILSTDEPIPVVGLGTWRVLDVRDPRPLEPVIDRFAALGGRVIDTSPMCGRAEAAVGALAPRAPSALVATKVWARGRGAGGAQVGGSPQCAAGRWSKVSPGGTVAQGVVTCVTPAPGKIEHLEENMRGGEGRVLAARERARLRQLALSAR